MGLETFLISPLESAKVRKSRVRPTKTDALDCGVIAEVAYTRSLRRATPISSPHPASFGFRLATDTLAFG